MRYDSTTLERLLAELESIRQKAFWLEHEFESELGKLEDSSLNSARNLLHYMALRRQDLRHLQKDLAALGLSSLGRAESHVLGSLEAVISLLHHLIGREFDSGFNGTHPVSFGEGKRRLRERTEALFGPASDGTAVGAPVRIMVTMPTDAARNYLLVRNLVANGMNCMRINCAHDDRVAWGKMIEHLKRACRETGKDCRLLMDLAGPKLRTGAMEPGPRVVCWEPKRDVFGKAVAPASIWLTPLDSFEQPPLEAEAVLPLDGGWLARLRPGDRIRFRDLRGKSRVLGVKQADGASWWAESYQVSYVGPDTVLSVRRKVVKPGEDNLPGEIAASGILPVDQHLYLFPGEVFRLTRDPTPGKPVLRDADGKLLEEPAISCTIPDIFRCVKTGERVWFDDGKMGGIVVSVSPEALRVRVTDPQVQGRKLKADKGINFPDSQIELPALTAKDLEDLDFVVEHADMVGLSFVNYTSDIEELQRQIATRRSRRLGIVLKIETRRAFQHLPRLLLTALRTPPVGVMIARGDLAVECGFERLAEAQEEVLWVCEAAHIPVIWATQVLETLNKKGMPSRAEVTDAAMGERAECVMLNKGSHMVETIRMLSGILGRMQLHQEKKSSLLRGLGVARMD